MNTTHAVREGGVDRCRFRQHAVSKLAVVAQLVEGSAVDIANQGARIADIFEYACSTCEQDQFFGVKFSRKRSGYRVGINIESRAALVA